MTRLVPFCVLTLMGCMGTARSDDIRNRPDKTQGPMFDDNEVPDHPSTQKPPQKPTGNSGNSEVGDDGEVEKPEPQNPGDNAGQGDDVKPPVVISQQSWEGNENLPFGLLEMTGGQDSWIIARDQYVLSWNPKTRNPNWVAWKLTAADLGTIGRAKDFTSDPIVTAYADMAAPEVKAVTTRDYTGSCFDRGHVVPSSERQASVEDNQATFHMTNIIPQTAFLNQRIWRGLEDQVKNWIAGGMHQNLWMVSGPVYDKKLHFIGPKSDIAIPKASYKMVFSWDEAAEDKPFLVKAILVPNMTSQGTIAYDNRDELCAESKSGGQVKGVPIVKSMKFDDYQATVDVIEAAAQIRLPAAIP